jgi:hypothetical protein
MSTPGVNTGATGLVIRGYDPVACFTEGRPPPGRSDLEVEYQGGKYLFASPAKDIDGVMSNYAPEVWRSQGQRQR